MLPDQDHRRVIPTLLPLGLMGLRKSTGPDTIPDDFNAQRKQQGPAERVASLFGNGFIRLFLLDSFSPGTTKNSNYSSSFVF